MTQSEYLKCVRSASINVSNRNCNLVDLGYVINDVSLTQLQFLSLLEQCFMRINIFDAEQLINLDNILNYVLSMEIINGEEYNMEDNSVVNNISLSEEDEKIMQQICLWFASYGADSLKECTASCKQYNQNAIATYNMFMSGICANTIGQTKLYETIKKYIVSKLSQVGFTIE